MQRHPSSPCFSCPLLSSFLILSFLFPSSILFFSSPLTPYSLFLPRIVVQHHVGDRYLYQAHFRRGDGPVTDNTKLADSLQLPLQYAYCGKFVVMSSTNVGKNPYRVS